MADFWNVTNPDKPRGVKDPDAMLDYTVNWVDWLNDAGDTYASHEVITTGTLVADHSSQQGGAVTVWLTGGTPGETDSFTVRMLTVGGRIDDRTLYLKIKDR